MASTLIMLIFARGSTKYRFLKLLTPCNACIHCQSRTKHVLNRPEYFTFTASDGPLSRWSRLIYSSLRSTSSIENSVAHTLPIDPYKLVEADLASLCDNVKTELSAAEPRLREIAHYHFDGEGKAFRPVLIFLLSKACNFQNNTSGSILPSQRVIAMVAEMIHTASLVHDDVIDAAQTRRGQASVQIAWGQRQAILTGDYILSAASMALAKIGNDQVVQVLSQVLEDLVRGEFMQLGSRDDENERFKHYLKKTFKKTASLIANSCKAVSILANCSESVVDVAYEYGKNIGVAFQLVDDLLDFVSSEAMMGKPTAADLKLGLATAPVLFAAQQHDELNPMIMRRFSEPGDIERARSLVAMSDGVAQTRCLAEQHCKEAIRQITQLKTSPDSQALVTLTYKVLNRLK